MGRLGVPATSAYSATGGRCGRWTPRSALLVVASRLVLARWHNHAVPEPGSIPIDQPWRLLVASAAGRGESAGTSRDEGAAVVRMGTTRYKWWPSHCDSVGLASVSRPPVSRVPVARASRESVNGNRTAGCQSPAGLASTSRPHGRVPVARRSRESVTATARQSASETVCKPSPVPPLARRRRSSIWDRGCPRPRAADPRTRRRRPVHARPRAPCRSSYLALHQVELARFTRSGTASRPDRFVTVALVLASRRTGVTRYPASGSSDFPRDRQVALQVPRPSDRLAGMRSLARRADATPAIGVVDLRTAASCRPAAARPSRRRAAAVGRVAASSRRSSRGTPFDRTAPARRTPHPPAGRLSAQPRHRWADHHVVGPLLRKRPLLGSPPRVRDGGATPDRGQRRTEDNAGPRTTPRSPPTRCTSPRTGRPPIVPMTKWRVLVPQTAFGSNGTGT